MAEDFKYQLRVNFTSGQVALQQVTFEACSIDRVRDDASIRIRDKLSGSITVWGQDADRFAQETVYRLSCELWIQGGDKLMDAWISLQNTTYLNQNKSEFEFEILDNYTALYRVLDEDRYPTHSAQVNVIYSTYLVSKYQGVIKGSTGVPVDNYQACGTLFGSQLPVWDDAAGYLAAQIITIDEVYQADSLEGSFVSWSNQGYVALQDNSGVIPGTDQSVWMPIFEVLIYSQERSSWQFAGSTYNELFGYWWAPGCTTQTTSQSIIGVDVYQSFAAHLISYGYTINKSNFLKYISDNYPKELNLLLYVRVIQETGGITELLSLKDYISFYEFLFNVQWRLDGLELIFKHPTELNQDLPGTFEEFPFYYLDRIYAKDWSSEEFTFSLTDKIYKETIQCGESQDLKYTPVEILYETPFEDDFNRELNDMELDVAYGLSDVGESDRILMAFDPSTNNVYEDELSLIKLVLEHYQQDRPFEDGSIRGNDYKFTQRPNHETSIVVPYVRQDLLDFDYQILSAFGQLTIKELQVDMSTKQTTITAGK